ncbi:hypothetical protein Sango_2295000 [Sesamum angolense]|uniref:Transposase MuDR plant domain-containing protein n=1 Tax=Sesamum angolense TaxID=2727404 RepID=A0AAE1WA38_9LAMI|nr:hypothetical protein Sango_2295000 [Sesamum angolense]
MLKFYYKDPTLPLEWGIRPTKEECPDLCLVDLQNCHRIFDVPVNIYVEEEEDEPLQAIDSQGNPIEKEQEEEIRFLLEGIDFEELGGNEIEGDGRKDCEGQGVEGLSLRVMGDKTVRGRVEGQGLDRDEVERSDCEGQGVELGVDDNFIEIPIQQEDSNKTDNVTENVTDNITENVTEIQNQNITEKGKRRLYERFLNESSSEFDDSSDERLCAICEDETEDDLVSLEGSEGSETEKHPVYKKYASMKNLNLVVGMKFENAAQFRGVLRDWCIRNGVDLEFLRNEAARVTAKCKSCEWKIHASPIQGGATFQIKTIKGEHTCARTYDNKLANASYIAKRIENAIRDHPTIPVQQLKNRNFSKCNVDVSRFKVMRAKKEALERIRGADAKQYELLWDYCETVRKFYGGQLLVAVGRDGNDNMFPIAMAVVQVENRDTWSNVAVHEEIPPGSQAPPPLSQEQTSAKSNVAVHEDIPQGSQPPTPMQQQVGYQGPRNASLLGNVNPASSSEVLDKVKERQKRRQQD